MSYEDARIGLRDIKQYALPKTNPIEYNLASALLNLTDAIERDFRSLRSEISALHKQVEDLAASR
jgi:polyhydroxyalkanoate synthesis regulator phasin